MIEAEAVALRTERARAPGTAMSASDRPRLDEAQIARSVLAQRVKLFTDRAVASAYSSPLGSILLAAVQAQAAGWKRALAWLCLINLAELLIVAVGYRFRRAQAEGSEPLTWAKRMTYAVLLAGLAWGVSVWFFWVEGQYLYYLLCLLVLVGVVGVDIVIMSPFRGAVAAVTAGTLLPPMLQLAVVTNPFAAEIAIGLTILFVLVLQHSRVAEKQLIGGLESAARNAALVRELARRTSALEASQAELNRAQALARVGSWVYEIARDSLRLSAEGCRIFGLPEGASSSYAAHLARVHVEDRERVDADWRAASSGSRTLDTEYRVCVGDGVRWVRQQAALEFGAEGTPQRRVGTIQDITERKQADAALQESESRYRRFAEELTLGIVITQDGIIKYVNPATVALSGYTEQELLGKPFAAIVCDADREWLLDLHRRRMRGEEVEKGFVIGIVRKDGAQRQWRFHTNTIDWAGRRSGYGIISDVTEENEAEAMRANLEAQLRESQKMEALGTLAGGVAHDFNNALAIIAGNVELARQDVGAGHAALASLEEIDKVSRRSKDLVQQILAFTRRQKTERKPTSLALVVVESVRLLRASFPAKLGVDVQCDSDTPAVLADATQVNQILFNLCTNAAQALQELDRPGAIAIRLQAHAQRGTSGMLRPGRYACLTVRDNGPGMDEATRARIFEPFFTTKPVGKGTGLGLAVVHGIVEAHHGSIEVESAPGKGSIFRIYFPAIDVEISADAAQQPGAAQSHGQGKHVLYLDDEESLVLLMKRLLERQGYRVSGYTDPDAALAAVRADPAQFDLAVTDYNMPGKSGLDVARVLSEIRADLPIVLASGYITEELRAKAPAAGVRALVYKPNTVDDLCAAVAHFANAQSANDATQLGLALVGGEQRGAH